MHGVCRGEAPCESASVATQELVRLIESNRDGLRELDPMRDLRIQDMDLVEQFQRITFLRSSLLNDYKCVHDPNFTDDVSGQFELLRDRKHSCIYENEYVCVCNHSLRRCEIRSIHVSVRMSMFVYVTTV